MSADVKNPDLVTITVDGVEMKVPKGSMIIEASDAANIRVPRFCYHKKLSIAANCRMCLVEVERAPKPMPACATPVAEGMKVFTQSPKAIAAQKGVMEFLLINHPLDCPICDQGGECELQDVSFGYGRGISRFTERKRVVEDENLGPLIATEMTRCIHCTRCVRFLGEVAGQRELGTMGRGEHTTISTYIEQGVNSEMSGNIIDLCPVGALTSKPYRFTARAWEMLSRETVAPHDAVGSNVHAHYLRGRIKRVVPRDNEELNECWLSDRDRFSYQGIYAEDRLLRPMVKRDGQWEEVDWEIALAAAVDGLRKVGGEQLGTLVTPTATAEEMYLLGKITRALGSRNIDARLRQADFSDDASAPVHPHLGQSVADLERLKSALLIGTDTRAEAPIINHRLRKASLRGAQITLLNPRRFEMNFRSQQLVVGAPNLVSELALVALALVEAASAATPAGLAELAAGRQVGDEHRRIAKQLQDQPAAVLVGGLVETHPAGAALRALAALIAQLAGASYGQLPQAGNSVGAWIAGAVPHRAVGGKPEAQPGLNARAMLEQPRKGYVLFGVEPELDSWDGAQALKALSAAEFVLALTPYVTERMKQYADVLLPVGTFSETAGTLINLEGRWQSFGGVAQPVGEARPAWRLLRVLGNLLELDGFEYESSEEVLAELKSAAGTIAAPTAAVWRAPTPAPMAGRLLRVAEVPMYAGDAIVRRAKSLQDTIQARAARAVYLSEQDATALGLKNGDQARLTQAGEAVLPVVIDDDVPAGTVWVAAAVTDTAGLGPMVGEISVARA